MTVARRTVLAAACVAATLGARFPSPALVPAPVATVSPIAWRAVVSRYAAALRSVREPKIVVFDYAVEQLGLRNLEQTHRIYRSGERERDETRVVDGYTLVPPAIRTLAVRDRYAIARVAPRPATTKLVFVREDERAGIESYVFRVVERAPSDFRVREVEIDGRSFLPSLVRFSIVGGKARGTGEIAYDRAGSHWLVQRASTQVTLADGSPAHERIVFTGYNFPKTLPPSTFETQRSAAASTAVPLVTPAPVPVVVPLPNSPKFAPPLEPNVRVPPAPP